MKINIKRINFLNIKTEILSNLTKLKTQEKLVRDYDEYYLSINDLLIYGMKTYGICILISVTFYRSIILAILLLPISFVYPFFIKRFFIEKRKEKLLNEFKDFLRVLKSNLEASYSLENSFMQSKSEMRMLYGDKSLMYVELDNMSRGLKMNVPVEVVFDEFARKTKVSDIQDFSDSLIVTKEMGGNINKTINNVISIINDKIEVEREIALSTASKKFEQNIMSFLPFFIILYLNITSAEFLKPLYINIMGRIFMTILLGVYFASIYISKKILEIET